MKKSIKLFCIILTIQTIASGCASSGKNFKYQNRNLIELNKTTPDEAVQYLGKPSSKEFKSTKDGDFEIFKYVYAYATPSGASARLFYIEFKNGKLNGKIYNSGFKQDITEFSFENHKNLKVGASNKDDVIKFLGPPSGEAICPSTLADFSDKCKEATEIWAWIHTKKSEGYDTKTIKSKTLKISFDSSGTVVNIDASKDEDN